MTRTGERSAGGVGNLPQKNEPRKFETATVGELQELLPLIKKWKDSRNERDRLWAFVLEIFLQNDNKPLPYHAYTTGQDDIANRLVGRGFIQVLERMSESGIDHQAGVSVFISRMNVALRLAGFGHIRLAPEDSRRHNEGLLTKLLVLKITSERRRETVEEADEKFVE